MRKRKRKPIEIIKKNEKKPIEIIEKREREKLLFFPIIPYKMRNVSTVFLEQETENVTKHIIFLKNENRNRKQGSETLPNRPLIVSK